MNKGKRYSVINYLNNCPNSWEVIRNKYLFTESKELVGNDFGSYALLSLTTKGIVKKSISNYKGKLPASFSTYQKVKKGDIVLCLFDLDVSAVFSGISNYDGMISSAYKIIKCTDSMNPKYLSYWFNMIGFRRLYIPFSKSLRYTISSSDFKEIYSLKAPLMNQIKIANFLDNKVSLIDNIISKTKESIEYYKQYKQSLITEVVTKGLNPNAEMKETGIEWIGKIPKHWKISSVKQHYNVVLGKMLQSEKHGDNDFLKDYLCAKDISWDGINTQNLKKMWISLKERESLRIKTGDLIVTEGGNVGVAAIVKNSIKECYIQNALHKVESKGNSDNTFLYYWLYFVKKIGYVDLICNKATFAHFTKSKFENLTLVYPPSKEQNQLVIYLNDKSEKIDTIINNKELLIKQLESYKKSLIYEVVTGKKEIN